MRRTILLPERPFALERVSWLLLSAFVVVVDQLVKTAVSSELALCMPGRCESIQILPVFQLTRLHNPGAAFSFLADAGGWQRWFLVVISSSVSLVIMAWILRLRKEQGWVLAVALSLILGGAIGNLADRVMLGYVIDYVVVHYGDWYFPAFNVADSAVSVGAAFLVLDMFIMRPQDAG